MTYFYSKKCDILKRSQNLCKVIFGLSRLVSASIFHSWLPVVDQLISLGKREGEKDKERRMGREVRRTTAKRDPGSPVRKLRLREHARLHSAAARRGKRRDAKVERKRERKKERNRQREEENEEEGEEEIRGAKPDGTPGISR